MEADILFDRIREELHGLVDDAYLAGMNFIFEQLEGEIEHPTCLTCKYCEYVTDEINFEEVTLPYLHDCFNVENKQNPEFMKMFEDAMNDFEFEAPAKFSCHKFSFQQFKKFCEMMERER